MKRLAPLLVICACADPAVLDVVVKIEETGLDSLLLKVTKNPDDGPVIFDCRMPLDAPAEGSCPSDEGEGRWSDPQRLEVLLYGKPDTAIAIELEGFRSGRSVTATRAVTLLPPIEGERRTLPLALLGLTRERFRCSVTIDPPATPLEAPLTPEQQTSLTLLSHTRLGRAPKVLVSARGRLAWLDYTRAAPGCTLNLNFVETIASRPITASGVWCHLTPGSLVAGPSQFGSVEPLIAGVCANGNDIRLKAAIPDGRASWQIYTHTFARGRRHFSSPTLANVIGDGRREIIFLARKGEVNNGPVELVIWSPGEGGTATVSVALPNVRFDQTIPAPIVLPIESAYDRVVVAGGRGNFGVVQDLQFLPLGAEPGRSARAPSVRFDPTRRLVELFYASPASVLRHQFTLGGRVETSELLPLSAAANNLDIRLALGSVDDDDEPEVGVGQAGFVELYPFGSPFNPTLIDLWRGSTAGEQFLLLANLDRQAGAEVVSFGAESSKIHAVDAAGQVLDGWPLQITGDDGRRHVLLADLDPVQEVRALRDLEVVTLSSAGLVEVITLGPGSYDAGQTPWPLPTRDGLGRSVYLGPEDPHDMSALTARASTQ